MSRWRNGAFSAFHCSNLCPATLGHHERRVDEAFFFIQRTSVAKLVSNIRQQPPQNLIAAPSLKAPMYRFVLDEAARLAALGVLARLIARMLAAAPAKENDHE